MKTKDIITLACATIVIAVSVYFSYTILFPAPKSTVETTPKTQAVPDKIDDNAYQNISKLSDYGAPALQGIGKSDLFAGF